jgi:fructokinase
MEMPEIICLGELLIDMVSSQLDAKLSESPGFVRAPGGAPANVAVGISRLGGASGFIGSVGCDHFGMFLQECLAKENVDVTSLLRTEKARTTLAFIAVRSDQAKEIVFYRHPGADMMLEPSQIDEHYIRNARCFHFGSISLINEPARSATLKAIEFARKYNLLISYDPNYRPDIWDSPDTARERIRSVMGMVDIIKISEEEWEFVTGTADFHQGAQDLFKSGIKLVVISRGEKGAWFAIPGFEKDVPGYTVEVVETTGAGDAFVASLLVQMVEILRNVNDLSKIESETIVAFIQKANAAGALACTKPGAIPALPTGDEVDVFIKNLAGK